MKKPRRFASALLFQTRRLGAELVVCLPTDRRLPVRGGQRLREKGKREEDSVKLSLILVIGYHIPEKSVVRIGNNL